MYYVKLRNGITAYDLRATSKGFFDVGLRGRVRLDGKTRTIFWNHDGTYAHQKIYSPTLRTLVIRFLPTEFDFMPEPREQRYTRPKERQMTIFELLEEK